MAERYNNGGLPGAPRFRLTVGRRIRLIRQQRGWSQEVLAELADLNRSYVGAVERGEHNIGIDTIERLAFALEITMCQLVGCVEPGLAPLPLKQEV